MFLLICGLRIVGNVLTAFWGALHQVCTFVTCNGVFCCGVVLWFGVRVKLRVELRVEDRGQCTHGLLGGRCTRLGQGVGV